MSQSGLLRLGVLCAAPLGALALSLPGDPAPQAGLVIQGARVVDGTGGPSFEGSVRIREGRIVDVGDVRPRAGEEVVDARGLILAPGFIDTHSHHDRGLFDEPEAFAAVSQGITTIVVGQDGGSNLPLADFFGRLEEEPAGVNVASFAGHNTLRREVMGEDPNRPATEAEVRAMGELLRAELAAGALGLSSGLEYDPGIHASTDEVIELARIAAGAGGRYISHVRSEDRALFEAVDEAILIGREAGLPVQVSHMKLAMRSLWGRADELLARLDEARADGVEVTADVYPYTAWQSTMTVLFPERDFNDLDAARFAVDEAAPPDGMLIARFDPDTSLAGMTLSRVSELRGTEPARTLLDLIAESRAAREAGEPGDESVIAESMAEEDVIRLLQWPHTNLSSDGGLGGGHPRGFGAFPRVLARYVREEGALTLEQAIHRMSGLAAQHMGIRERGTIRPGAAADLVLLDPNRVRDRATFREPRRPAEGIGVVWVNGVEVYRAGKVTGARPGTVIRREGAVEGRIDAIFREFDSSRSPGCAVGVVEEGRLSFARGYGMANLEHGVPLGPSSVFRMASVSKQFTAAVALLLERDGKLSLDDEVRLHIPELPEYERPLTVRHLIHHTAGLRDYLALMSLAGRGPDDVYTEEDVVAVLARQERLNFPPGDRHLYSNSGYFLLSELVRRVAGRTLAEYAEEELFRPLGMGRSHFHDDHTRIVEGRAEGYAPREGGSFGTSRTQLNMVGDGGVFTSVEEMARWEALFQGAFGEDHPLAFLPERMLERGVLATGDTIPYAFGLVHGELRGLRTVTHGGSFVGYRTHLLRLPDQGMSVTVLCNVSSASPGQLAERVAEALVAEEMDPPEEESNPARGEREEEEPHRPVVEDLAAYEGDFRSDELGVTYRIRLEEGFLGLVEPRSLRGFLDPQGPDAFRRGPMTFRFHRDEDGAVTHLEVGTGRAFGIRFVPTAHDPDGG